MTWVGKSTHALLHNLSYQPLPGYITTSEQDNCLHQKIASFHFFNSSLKKFFLGEGD